MDYVLKWIINHSWVSKHWIPRETDGHITRATTRTEWVPPPWALLWDRFWNQQCVAKHRWEKPVDLFERKRSDRSARRDTLDICTNQLNRLLAGARASPLLDP